MNDTITQARLAMRLDAYLNTYMGKQAKEEPLYRETWDVAWKAAEVARTMNTLTPELVDDVRIALNNF